MASSLFRQAFTLTAAVSLGLAGCSKPKAAAPTLLTVQTSTIKEATFAPSVEAISQLESTTNVAVKPQIDGTVVKILMREGQTVQAGQIILMLDNVQQSAALDAARSEAIKDKINAERYDYLYKQGAVSAKERDRYVTEAIQSRDEVRSDAADLGYKFVRAPIDGVIGDLDTVKLGDYVKAGQTITGIVNNSTLWTLMEIPATQASRVKLGQTVTVESQTDPPVRGKGAVTFISPYFGISGSDNAPNTLMVKAEFPNLTGQLKTGQYVTSTIITAQQQSLAVPVQAVLMQAEQPFVYRLVPLSQALPRIKASKTTPETTKTSLESLPGNTPIAVQTKVTLGDLQNDLYPIKSGLKASDVVVVSNTSRLRSGMPVKVSKDAN